MKKNSPITDVAIQYTTELSLMEIGLGSFLHSFHIPFSGHLLALNQCFILNRAVIHSTSSRILPMTISNTAAILKTLSPRGKRFTPMLAITMQGLLFNFGILLFGSHFLGRCIASLLLSLWPIAQPLLIYGLILGNQLSPLISFYTKMFSNGQAVLIGVMVLYLLLSFLVSLIATYLPLRWIDKYRNRFITPIEPARPKRGQKVFPKDLYSFPFLLSMTLCAIFFYVTLDSLLEVFFALCRVLGIAYITFIILRNIPINWFLNLLQKFPMVNQCAPHIEEVLKSMRKEYTKNC